MNGLIKCLEMFFYLILWVPCDRFLERYLNDTCIVVNNNVTSITLLYGLSMTKTIYKNMLKSSSKIAAAAFLKNELAFIESILSELKSRMTVVVVGCHDGMYYESIKKLRFNYIGIDPYTNSQRNPHILQMSFESYAKQRKQINKNQSVFIFWFNVLSHIDISAVNNCFIDGDIIINSLWGGQEADINIRNGYYSTFNDDSQQYQTVFQAAKKSHSLNNIDMQIKSIDCFYNSPNYFEVARI